MHTPNTYHPHLRTSVQPDQPYRIINDKPVTILPRTYTILTIPCTLPNSGNYIFKPSEQDFVEQPVHYTPIKISAEKANLSVHFINHSNQELVIPKHSCVGTVEKVQESEQDMCHTDTSP